MGRRTFALGALVLAGCSSLATVGDAAREVEVKASEVDGKKLADELDKATKGVGTFAGYLATAAETIARYTSATRSGR